MNDFLMNVGVPFTMIGGIFYLFYRAFKSIPDADAEEEQQEEEEQEEEHEEIKADIVAKQIQATHKTRLYNRMQGDLLRVQRIQTELDKVEKMITSIEAYGYFTSNGQIEKKYNLSCSTFGGEMIDFDFDIVTDAESREMLLNTLLRKRESLRTSLLDEMTKISAYAVSQTESQTIKDYDYNTLRGVVKNVLAEVKNV